MDKLCHHLHCAPGCLHTTGGLELSGDASFMLDILVNFRTAFYSARGRLVSSRGAIACHYASTWLAVDILAAMPWDAIFSVYNASNFLNFVKVARLFRLLKAVKLRHHARALAFLSSVEVRSALCRLSLVPRQAREPVHIHCCLPWSGVLWRCQLPAVGFCTGRFAPRSCSRVLLPLHCTP